MSKSQCNELLFAADRVANLVADLIARINAVINE